MAEELLKPAAAAQKLDMPPSTLRVYSTRFAELLSEAASNPPSSPDGKPGHRLYAARDLLILSKAKDLLSHGVTYEQAIEELRSAGFGHRSRPRQQASLPSDPPIPSVHSTPSLDGLVRAVEGWQTLAEERARENALLRQRISALEQERDRDTGDLLDRLRRLELGQAEVTRKSGWLARLFGR